MTDCTDCGDTIPDDPDQRCLIDPLCQECHQALPCRHRDCRDRDECLR